MFLGLGELLCELRELLKDLSFRNRQERELGDLSIIERRLELSAYPEPDARSLSRPSTLSLVQKNPETFDAN